MLNRFDYPLHFCGRTLIVGIFVAALAGNAFAAENDPLDWVPPTHVQMVPMMLPMGNTSGPITFILEAKKRKQTEGICEKMPRIRDALLSVLSRNPIPVKKRKMILTGLDQRILKPMNRAVGRAYIKKVYVFPGAVRLGAGKIKNKRYAVIDGCENILRSELARREAAKAAKK